MSYGSLNQVNYLKVILPLSLNLAINTVGFPDVSSVVVQPGRIFESPAPVRAGMGFTFSGNDVTSSFADNYSIPAYSRVEKRARLERTAYALFGEMRSATKEENESVKNYIKSISKPTGVNIFDLC